MGHEELKWTYNDSLKLAELVNDEDFRDFVEELQVFACKWVEEVNVVILEHILELYKDPAVKHLVHQYAIEVKKVEFFNCDYLINAIENSTLSIYHSAYDYSQALYELCYRRFVKEVK